MRNSERDPLFFPPSREPQGFEETGAPEEYSAELDPGFQQKGLRRVAFAALALFVFIIIGLRPQAPRDAWQQLLTVIHPPKSRPSSLPPAKTGVNQTSEGSNPEEAAAGAEISEADLGIIRTLSPQRQAEELLLLGVSGSSGAISQIEDRIPDWAGKLSPTRALLRNLNLALGSKGIRLRRAAATVELSAYGLSPAPASAENLIQKISTDPSSRPALLPLLGMLGNLGVLPGRARETLLAYVHDPLNDIRGRAVEGLALMGGEENVSPLLEVLYNDPAPEVRREVARSLGSWGIFTDAQRMTAVPDLIQDTANPRFDAQTRAWIFAALRNITGEKLPDNPAAWQQRYSAGNRKLEKEETSIPSR